MGKEVTRRNFLAGAGVFAAGAAVASMTGCAGGGASSTPSSESWIPEAWDHEADVVIVGMGGGGIAAAIAATKAGSSVLVLEAAPEAERGGNTRVSGNMMLVPDTVEDGVAYQTALNGPYIVDEGLMNAWATQFQDALAWIQDDLGLPMEQGNTASPEFTEVVGHEAIHTWICDGVQAEEKLWTELFNVATELGISFNYERRAVKLIFDPATKEVYGVQTEDGETWKGKKATILACGGFENNQDMIMNNFCAEGNSQVFFVGTPYNRGDGHKMVSEVGAQLWHMNSYAGAGVGIRSQSPDTYQSTLLNFGTNKDFI